jgi:hypothetical protein
VTARGATPAASSGVDLRPDRGGALSFRLVAMIFTTLLALGVGLGFVIHRSYVGFERVAARHVPPDATFVLRWDVEKVSLFEPTRHFLLPLLDEPHAPPPAPSSSAAPPHRSPLAALWPSAGPVKAASNGRRDRFAAESGCTIARDLREVVAMWGPADGDWAVVLAGSFPKLDLIAAIERTLTKEGWAWRPVGADRLVSPEGAALGRGADGVLVIASSLARLGAVLPARDPPLEIPREGAGAFELWPHRPGLPAGTSSVLGSVAWADFIDGTAQWGSPLPVQLSFHHKDRLISSGSADVHQVLERLFGDDLARLEHNYGPAKFLPSLAPADERAITVTLLLDDVALERAANRATETVERALGHRPAQE